MKPAWLEATTAIDPDSAWLLQAGLTGVMLAVGLAIMLWAGARWQRRLRSRMNAVAADVGKLKEQFRQAVQVHDAVQALQGQQEQLGQLVRNAIQGVGPRSGGPAEADPGSVAPLAADLGPALLARLVQDVELLQKLSATGPLPALNAALDQFRPILEGAGWKPATTDPGATGGPQASACGEPPVRRLRFAGAGPPMRSQGWAGPGDEAFPGVVIEPTLEPAVVAAAVAGTPAAAALPPRGPLSMGQVAALLLSAGLWLDAQWAAAATAPAKGDDAAADPAQPASAGDLFRKAKAWRDQQVRDLPDLWEWAPDAEPRMCIMEMTRDGPEQLDHMQGLRSKPLGGATLPPAVLVTAAAPVYHTLWDQGRQLRDMGVADDDVDMMETVRFGLFLSWQLSYKAPDAAAGARRREQMALTWARLLLDVRSRDLRRRAKSATLTPALLDRWDDVTRRLSGDLRTVGWHLGTEADLPAATRWADAGALDLAEVSWPVPSSGDCQPRWLRPPLLPPLTPPQGPGEAIDAGSGHFLGQAELAKPTPAATRWHDLVLTAAWTSAGQVPAGNGAPALTARSAAERMKALWAAAGRISQRQCTSSLDGPDSDLKQAVIEEFWVPLYALADAALGLAPAPTDAGRAWLGAVTEQLGGLGLMVRPATETEPTRFREAGLGEAAGRPAVIDLCDGRTICYGLLPRRAQPAAPSPVPAAARPIPRTPVAAAAVSTTAAAPAPRARSAGIPAANGPVAATAVIARTPGRQAGGLAVPRATASAAALAPQTSGAAAAAQQRPAQSVWHALVCDLFDARVGRSKPAPNDQAQRERLLEVATRIDCRQQDLVLDGPDDALKQMIAEQFWRPLYNLAEATFGLSSGAGNGGGAWLNGMRAALAAVQLDVIPPGGGNSDAGWFRRPDPGADLPGRPALVDAATRAVVGYGTYPDRGR